MYLQIDPPEDPLKTHPIQTGREMSIQPYPNRQFWFIDDPDRQFGDGSVLTRTRTRSDGPEPLLTLLTSEFTLMTNLSLQPGGMDISLDRTTVLPHCIFILFAS